MEIINIKNKKQLNSFVASQPHAQFLQSWEWGEFQERAGNKILRIGVEENNVLLAAMTLVKKSLPMNKNYIYCPRGPIVALNIRSKKYEVLSMLFDELRKVSKKEEILFLRFEPTFDIESIKPQVFKTIDVQPSRTIMIDLRNSQKEILKKMHQKTRYNIRLAEKRGVKIIVSSSDTIKKDFNKFWPLMRETVKRDEFRLHDKEYYFKMLVTENTENPVKSLRDNGASTKIPHYAKASRGEQKHESAITGSIEDCAEDTELITESTSHNSKSLSQEERLVLSDSAKELKIRLFLAEYKSRVIAASIVSFFGDTATYMHGASSNEHRNVMAPFLLQWHAIKEAMCRGASFYDFYGIDEKKWPGVTRFKKGFGGQELEYPGAFDLAFRKVWYFTYRGVRKIRRMV